MFALWRRRQANRRRAEGWGRTLLSIAALAVVTAVLVPFVAEVFLRWLASPKAYWPAAIQALLLRADIVIVGWLAVDVYGVLVRGGDRAVLSLWPVDPARVVRFELARLAVKRVVLVPAAAVLLLPLAIDPWLWFLAVVQIAGAWGLTLALSGTVVMFAVHVAHDPRWRPVLDLIRGNNHPAQAAFLYAPAATLLLVGAALQASAVGVSWLWAGDWAGLPLLLLPFVLTPVPLYFLSGLASRNWTRAGQVMAEVDGRYRAIEDREDALRVYLDWFVRFLPAGIGRFTLLDLRHGWRSRRSWVMGAWLAALASLVAAWTSDPGGPVRSASLATLGIWILAAVAIRLHQGEPAFLRQTLPTRSKSLGRAITVFLWLQPVVWIGALAAGIRQGVGAFGMVSGTALLSALVASVVATASARPGWVVYGPIAALAAVVTVMGLSA